MKYHHEKNVLIVSMEGELDFSNSTEIKSEIRRHLIDHEKDIVLDFRDLEFIDSSGVGVVISLLKTANSREGKLIVAGPSQDVEFVLKMTKVDQILDITVSTSEAIKLLGQ